MVEYKQHLVTCNNYREVFKNKPEDVLDIIFLAIKDNTPIGEYIDEVGSDYVRLNELRLSLRSGVPKRYISKYLSTEVLRALRIAVTCKKDLSQINKYISPMGTSTISQYALVLVVSLVIVGADLSDIDFRQIKDECLPIVKSAITEGYPVWQYFIYNNTMSANRLTLVYRGMQQGYDMSMFCLSKWSEDVIRVLISSGEYFERLVSTITHNFTSKQVTEVLLGLEEGLDVSSYTRMESGKPVFTSREMRDIRISLLADKGVSIQN